MLGHISFSVSNLDRAARFYDATLAALGYARVWTAGTAIGYGQPGTDTDRFAIKARRATVSAPSDGFHLAFRAPSRNAVDRFHAAALATGGRDNGAPGLRPHYGPDYYAAFVIDPDGYFLEGVCNAPLTIRSATPGDAAAICALHIASIRTLAASHYDAEAIARWSDKRPEMYVEAMQTHLFLVAERNGELSGFGELDRAAGKIHAVYVHPDHVGSGVGQALLAALEGQARRSGFGEVRLESSLNAVGFYQRQGYRQAGEPCQRASGLACVPMVKGLANCG